MELLNVDLSFMAQALEGKGINAKPKAMHKIGVSRRKTQIKNEVKQLEEGLTPAEEYKTFVNEIEELKKKYADKDNNGKIVEQEIPTQQGQKVKVPVVNERLDEYMKALGILRKKHAEVIADTKALNGSYDEVLMKKCELKLAYVLLSDFVQEKTTFEELFGIYPIIKDFDKDKLLKKTKKVKFSVVDIIGESDQDADGLADISNMTAFNPILYWDLSIVLAFNMRAIRNKAFELKKLKVFTDHKTKHELSRIELCENCAKPNINGDPMQNRGGYVIENVVEFNGLFDSLKVENKKVIDSYEKWLKTEIEIDIVTISADILKEIDDLLEKEEIDLTPKQADILDNFL